MAITLEDYRRDADDRHDERRRERRIAGARQRDARRAGRHRAGSSSATSTARSTSSTRRRRRSRRISTSTAATQRPGLFDKLPTAAGFANGLISFQFDPDYRQQRQALHHSSRGAWRAGIARAGRDQRAGLTTDRLRADGARSRRRASSSATPWSSSGPIRTSRTRRSRARRARLLRVELNTRIHPMGDLIFNPDGAARQPGLGRAVHRLRRRRIGRAAQRDAPEPAAARHAGRQDPPHHSRSLASHGPRATSARTAATGFRVTTRSRRSTGARKEVWASGLRNPHRLTWDVDPANRVAFAAARVEHRPPLLGDGLRHPQGRELRLLRARRATSA